MYTLPKTLNSLYIYSLFLAIYSNRLILALLSYILYMYSAYSQMLMNLNVQRCVQSHCQMNMHSTTKAGPRTKAPTESFPQIVMAKLANSENHGGHTKHESCVFLHNLS